MTRFLSNQEVAEGFKLVFQKNKSIEEIKELNQKYWAMREIEEECEKYDNMLYKCDNDEFFVAQKNLAAMAEQRNVAQKEFYSLEDSGVFEKYFASRMKPITEKNKQIEQARLAHANKVNEIIELFKKHDIILDINDDEVHKSYLLWNGKKVFFCQCDGEYDNIARVTLQKIIAVKKAMIAQSASHLAEYKDFFINFDTHAVVEGFEKLNEEDMKLYSNYVKLYTENE